jgi:hypothetical protein
MSLGDDIRLLEEGSAARAPYLKKMREAEARGDHAEAQRIYAEMRAATKEYDLPEQVF